MPPLGVDLARCRIVREGRHQDFELVAQPRRTSGHGVLKWARKIPASTSVAPSLSRRRLSAIEPDVLAEFARPISIRMSEAPARPAATSSKS